jgi:hypothetical protein
MALNGLGGGGGNDGDFCGSGGGGGGGSGFVAASLVGQTILGAGEDPLRGNAGGPNMDGKVLIFVVPE